MLAGRCHRRVGVVAADDESPLLGRLVEHASSPRRRLRHREEDVGRDAVQIGVDAPADVVVPQRRGGEHVASEEPAGLDGHGVAEERLRERELPQIHVARGERLLYREQVADVLPGHVASRGPEAAHGQRHSAQGHELVQVDPDAGDRKAGVPGAPPVTARDVAGEVRGVTQLDGHPPQFQRVACTAPGPGGGLLRQPRRQQRAVVGQALAHARRDDGTRHGHDENALRHQIVLCQEVRKEASVSATPAACPRCGGRRRATCSQVRAGMKQVRRRS